MPLLKSSKKKMRRDKRRTAQNDLKKQVMKSLVKTMRRMPDADNLKQVSSNLDKAAKTKLIHPNKASRLKSRLSKLMASPAATK
jgi:small subunit ribosomal protein S20